MTAADNPMFHCLRWIVFVLNFIFWVAGMGVLGVSLWLLFDAGFAQTIGASTGLNSFYTGVYILLAVGLLMTLFGFLGCCGALRLSQTCLTLFFILLLIIFILELICGILMYYYQEDVRKYVEDSMLDAIKVHYGQAPYTEAIDELQTTFECCGARSYKNWLHSTYVQRPRYHHRRRSPPTDADNGQKSDVIAADHDSAANDFVGELGSLGSGIGAVPASCCTPRGKRADPDCGPSFARSSAPLHTFVNEHSAEDSFIHPKGCNQALLDYYYDKSNLVILLAIGIGCLQLFGMILTMLLCCCISSAKRDSIKNRVY